MHFMNIRRKFRNQLVNRYGVSRSLQNLMQYSEQMLCGHREVLIKYLGYPLDTYFEAIIPQGKILQHEIEPIEVFSDRDGRPLLQLLWRSDAEEEAKKFGIDNVISIGATGLYALHNMGVSIENCKLNIAKVAANYSWGKSSAELLEKFKGKNVLYMPTHSWTGATAEHDSNEFKFLAALDKSKVRVCLGYLDYCDPSIRKLYLQFGWEIDCAGVKDSLEFPSPAGGRSNFLYELFSIFNWADIVLADELTTGQFYAVCLGKEIGLLPKNLAGQQISLNAETKRDFHLNKKVRDAYPWLSGNDFVKESIPRDVIEALGLDKFKSRRELSEIIPWHREPLLNKK